LLVEDALQHARALGGYGRLVCEEYDKHLASLHDAWATPPTVVAGLVAEVADTAVRDIRGIVAGAQNEVYDVTLERAPSLIVRISHGRPEAHDREAWVIGQCASRGIRAPRVHAGGTTHLWRAGRHQSQGSESDSTNGKPSEREKRPEGRLSQCSAGLGTRMRAAPSTSRATRPRAATCLLVPGQRRGLVAAVERCRLTSSSREPWSSTETIPATLGGSIA
jgi:hypothetical protein